MTTKNIKKLRITVTNIKSILVDNTKKLSSIKINKKRLNNNSLQLSKIAEKESKTENIQKSSPFSGFSKKVGSTFGNPIDTVTNAAVILAGGTLLNTLPPLVDKIKLAFAEVEKRFEQLNNITSKIGNFITAITDPIKKIFNVFLKSDNQVTKTESEDDEVEIEVEQMVVRLKKMFHMLLVKEDQNYSYPVKMVRYFQILHNYLIKRLLMILIAIKLNHQFLNLI